MRTDYPGFKTAVQQVSLGVNALCCVYQWCWLLLISKQNVKREEIVPQFWQRPLLQAA